MNSELTRSGLQECPHLVAVGGTFERTQQGQIQKAKAMSQSGMGGAWVRDSNSPIPAHDTSSPLGCMIVVLHPGTAMAGQVVLGATSQGHPVLVPQE